MRFLLNFVQHRLGEVEALLPLVGLGDVGGALALVVTHGLPNIVARLGGERRGRRSARSGPVPPAIRPPVWPLRRRRSARVSLAAGELRGLAQVCTSMGEPTAVHLALRWGDVTLRTACVEAPRRFVLGEGGDWELPAELL